MPAAARKLPAAAGQKSESLNFRLSDFCCRQVAGGLPPAAGRLPAAAGTLPAAPAICRQLAQIQTFCRQAAGRFRFCSVACRQISATCRSGSLPAAGPHGTWVKRARFLPWGDPTSLADDELLPVRGDHQPWDVHSQSTVNFQQTYLNIVSVSQNLSTLPRISIWFLGCCRASPRLRGASGICCWGAVAVSGPAQHLVHLSIQGAQDETTHI